ncbi:unnamed protein product, partial [Ixodes pacificus]
GKVEERQIVGLTGATGEDAALPHCTFTGATMPSVGVRLVKTQEKHRAQAARGSLKGTRYNARRVHMARSTPSVRERRAHVQSSEAHCWSTFYPVVLCHRKSVQTHPREFTTSTTINQIHGGHGSGSWIG